MSQATKDVLGDIAIILAWFCVGGIMVGSYLILIVGIRWNNVLKFMGE